MKNEREVSVFDWFCDCGFTTKDGAEAVQHVRLNHIRNNGRDTLRDRILQMIYTIRPHSLVELAMHADQPNAAG